MRIWTLFTMLFFIFLVGCGADVSDQIIHITNEVSAQENREVQLLLKEQKELERFVILEEVEETKDDEITIEESGQYPVDTEKNNRSDVEDDGGEPKSDPGPELSKEKAELIEREKAPIEEKMKEEPIPEVEPETEQQTKEKTEITQPRQDTKQTVSSFETRVVELTNLEREKNGLPALKINAELREVAREKSKDMMTNQYFDHHSPTYGSPFEMMNSFSITYLSAGENIAFGQRTPEEVVRAWMDSEGHRANILNQSFTHIGVGYVKDGHYWTQQFIGK